MNQTDRNIAGLESQIASLSRILTNLESALKSLLAVKAIEDGDPAGVQQSILTEDTKASSKPAQSRQEFTPSERLIMDYFHERPNKAVYPIEIVALTKGISIEDASKLKNTEKREAYRKLELLAQKGALKAHKHNPMVKSSPVDYTYIPNASQ